MTQGVDEQRAFFEFLLHFVSTCRKVLEDNVIGVVLVGAHVKRFVRSQQDVDLIVICDELPQSTWKRYDLVMKILETVEPEREKLAQAAGIPLYLSPVLKTKKEMEDLQPRYVVLIREGKILYDPRRWVKRYLDRIRNESSKGGSI